MSGFVSRWLFNFVSVLAFVFSFGVCLSARYHLITGRWKRSTKSDVQDFWGRKEVKKNPKNNKEEVKKAADKGTLFSLLSNPALLHHSSQASLQSVLKITAYFPS